MADPVTIAMGATAASAVVGAVGSVMGGNAKSDLLKYQAGVASMNEKIAMQNAAWEKSYGEVEAQESGMKTRAEVGKEKSIQSGSGLDVNKGSTVAVRQSQTEIGQFNEEILRGTAARRAYGYQTQAAGFEAEKNVDVMAASNEKTAGYISAASSILGGAAGVAGKWMQGQQNYGSIG